MCPSIGALLGTILPSHLIATPNNCCSHVFHLDCILAWLSLPHWDGDRTHSVASRTMSSLLLILPLKVAAAKAVRLRRGVGGGYWRRRISAARLP